MNMTSQFNLEGCTAIVTGGSKGIGLDIALTLAKHGADLVISGRNIKDLNIVENQIINLGRKCVSIVADLAKEDEIEMLSKKSLEHFKNIDILVNNAGTAIINSILKTTTQEWDEVMKINLKAPFLLSKLIAPTMIKNKKGKIINVSSQAGVFGLEDHSAYSSSKGGLNMLTKCMTSEWGKHNIQTNSVCPIVVMTQMGKQVWSDPKVTGPMIDRIPSGRFVETQEVADMVLFLASSASDMINGQIISVDGGNAATCWPAKKY